MAGAVTLLMAVHCHQPVGNFGFVFEEAFAKAYEPFVRVLERHPKVRLALHYSGPLLDWFQRERPEFLARVRSLAAKGRIELLASGYYEPILPMIPEPDRQGQTAMMREALRRLFRVDAQGLWLTERVWEPQLPETLANAGIRYTMVDTNQFASAKPWLPGALQIQDDAFWDLLGSYATQYNGAVVRLFPASKRLRYWLPFQPVDRTMEFLGRLRREQPVALTFADDGEKFGLWPKTHQWVYEEGWLDQFFSALERESSWLQTARFADYERQTPADGIVSLPTGSYEEMLEWSNGYFRNFFTKYPEANAMQQRMLTISEAIRTASRRSRASKLVAQATRELYAAQCNCAYWHGVFGGLYLGHLRRAVYRHLIAAEELVNRLRGKRVSMAVADEDGDGAVEAHVTTRAMRLVITPSSGGTVNAWHLYAPRLNLLDTLTRRPEPYHRKLRAQHESSVASGAATPASIHDVLGVKEPHLEDHLIYDDHRRAAFIDYALQGRPSLQDVVRSTWGERRLWSSGAYRLLASPRSRTPAGGVLSVRMQRAVNDGVLRKGIRVWSNRPVVEYAYEVDGPRIPVVALEFNLCLRDERYMHAPHEHGPVKRFVIDEPAAKVRLEVAAEPAGELFSFPIETVSESEQGLERTYQGLGLVWFWSLGGASKWSGRLRWSLAS